MIVTSAMVAGELRRRRVGRRGLADRLDHVDAETWLPGDVTGVPSSLLVLAALNMGRPTVPVALPVAQPSKGGGDTRSGRGSPTCPAGRTRGTNQPEEPCQSMKRPPRSS